MSVSKLIGATKRVTSSTNTSLSIASYKELLNKLNNCREQEITERRKAFWCVAGGVGLSMVFITVWCLINPKVAAILPEVFGATALIAMGASSIYLVFKQDEIDCRNNELMKGIFEGMREKRLDDEFVCKTIEEGLNERLKEIPKTPVSV